MSVLTEDADCTDVRHEPGNRAQQRRLAGSIGADERHPVAGRDLRRDVVDHTLPTETDGDGIEQESGHAVLRAERKTSAKNGAPKNAVTTPIGTSAGDSTADSCALASSICPRRASIRP